MHGNPEDQHLSAEVASSYDSNVAGRFDPAVLDPTVETLARLAADGPVLEFAIGTGRVALPLAATGLAVHGIDFSEPMVDQLRNKAGAGEIAVTIGDMTSADVGSDFALVYLVFNTIGNVLTQQGQTEVFVNAARHLAPGGRFVIETGVPGLSKIAAGQTTRVFASADDYLGFDQYTDPVNQVFVSHHWRIDGDQVRRIAGRFRWVWPSELDLMARIAGLELEHRWADWDRSPFSAESSQHVSVWRKPAA